MGGSEFSPLNEVEDIDVEEEIKSTSDTLLKEDNGETEEDYIHIQGRVSYGGKSKVHVLFIAIIGIKSSKLINFEATVSNRDELLYVPADNKGFLRIISKTSEEEKKKGRMVRAKLKERLTEEDIEELIKLFKADAIDEINQRFKSRLGDIVKEYVEVALFMELKDYEELEERYPHLFYERDEEVKEGGGDNQIIIDCLPQISAVHGKRIGELEKNDMILVRLSEVDYRNFSEKLSDIIIDNDKLEVRVEDIYFNDKQKMYYLHLDLGEDIKGRLIVESQSELKLAVPKVKDKETPGKRLYKSTNSQGIIFYSFVAISILAIVTIVLFYYI